MMNEGPTSDQQLDTSRRHLSDNATECGARNIRIHVEAVNEDATVAFCSVQQRERGLLRRTYSRSELVWRAEQALAPLIGLGLLPMINVIIRARGRTPASARHPWSPFDAVRRLRHWLGYPVATEGFNDGPLPGDPFGLRAALLPTAIKRGRG